MYRKTNMGSEPLRKMTFSISNGTKMEAIEDEGFIFENPRRQNIVILRLFLELNTGEGSRATT